MPSATGVMRSDFVKGMWLMLQQPQPDDYVLATGESHSVREFIELAFAQVGRKIAWQGNGDRRGWDSMHATGLDAGQSRPALFPANRGRCPAG